MLSSDPIGLIENQAKFAFIWDVNGNDPVLDIELLPYDIRGSKAHASVLENAGVLTATEKEKIVSELDNLQEIVNRGEFEIKVEDEDCHTAIENYLVDKLGELGKKIHTARSRNDQVITALRLMERDRISEIRDLASELHASFTELADIHKDTPMPGFTHTRKAMPYTVGKWFKAFADSFEDDLKLLDAVNSIVDQNPLGTGAGYDVSLPINREVSTRELGFEKTMENAMYVQNSRGKTESAILFACTGILTTLNRWATDIIMFTMPEFAFFSLDDTLTTGSSIMPHKKNPDVLELLRSSVHQLAAFQSQVLNTSLNLISGYNRDIQLTKEPLFKGLKTTLEALKVSLIVVEGLEVGTVVWAAVGAGAGTNEGGGV